MNRNKKPKKPVAQTGPEINNVKIPNCDKNILTLNSIENFNTRSRISFCTSTLASSKPQLSDSQKKLILFFLLIKGNSFVIWFTGDHLLPTRSVPKTRHLFCLGCLGLLFSFHPPLD